MINVSQVIETSRDARSLAIGVSNQSIARLNNISSFISRQTNDRLAVQAAQQKTIMDMLEFNENQRQFDIQEARFKETADRNFQLQQRRLSLDEARESRIAGLQIRTEARSVQQQLRNDELTLTQNEMNEDRVVIQSFLDKGDIESAAKMMPEIVNAQQAAFLRADQNAAKMVGEDNVDALLPTPTQQSSGATFESFSDFEQFGFTVPRRFSDDPNVIAENNFLKSQLQKSAQNNSLSFEEIQISNQSFGTDFTDNLIKINSGESDPIPAEEMVARVKVAYDNPSYNPTEGAMDDISKFATPNQMAQVTDLSFEARKIASNTDNSNAITDSRKFFNDGLNKIFGNDPISETDSAQPIAPDVSAAPTFRAVDSGIGADRTADQRISSIRSVGSINQLSASDNSSVELRSILNDNVSAFNEVMSGTGIFLDNLEAPRGISKEERSNTSGQAAKEATKQLKQSITPQNETITIPPLEKIKQILITAEQIGFSIDIDDIIENKRLRGKANQISPDDVLQRFESDFKEFFESRVFTTVDSRKFSQAAR